MKKAEYNYKYKGYNVKLIISEDPLAISFLEYRFMCTIRTIDGGWQQNGEVSKKLFIYDNSLMKKMLANTTIHKYENK